MRDRRRSPAIAVLLTVAALSTAGTAAAAQAQDRGSASSVKVRVTATTTAAAVLQMPRTLQAGADAVALSVRYQCRNPKGTTHYLTARLAQDAGALYVLGLRGDTGGLVRATCTGRPVTAVLQLQRSAYADPSIGLVDGPASLRVDLEARGADGTAAGWYTTTGPGATATATVQIAVP